MSNDDTTKVNTETMTEQIDSKSHSLTEQQELLLLRFLDQECGFFERLRAERLLKKSNDAHSFLREMQEIGNDTRRVVSDKSHLGASAPVDLWEKISIRIEQEERAERFLGRRPAVLEERLSPASSLWMAGATGAIASALLLTVVFKNSNYQSTTFASQPVSHESLVNDDVLELDRELVSLPSLSSGTPLVSYSGYQRRIPTLPVTTVSANSSVPVNAPLVERSTNAPVEVDWMRSDGSVRLLHDAHAAAPVIFVKKRNYTVSRNGQGVIDRQFSSGSSTSQVPTATFVSSK